jgi:hypothetical protein
MCVLTPAFAADLVVHEWGTFTSVAGVDGRPVPWASLAAPSDLPCFVHRLDASCVKCNATSTVRMETPVIYFYSRRPATVSVGVKLPSGVITEWYPQATGLPSDVTYGGNGAANWQVEITPGATPTFLHDGGDSHYYPARNTFAAPLQAGGEQEKMIFYRGIADAGVAIEARLANNTVELRSTAGAPVPFAVVFENRGGRSGYRIVRNIAPEATVERPALDAGDLPREMEGALAAAGLFPKEAAAMVATWRDTWFEEGLRVFYILPRKAVDEVLPLTISPAPLSTVRVFVGRVELLSPERAASLTAALATGDPAALAKESRFLDAFLARIPGTATSPASRAFLDQRKAQLAHQRVAPCDRPAPPVVTNQ